MAKNLDYLFSQMGYEVNIADPSVNRENHIPVAISHGIIFEEEFSTFRNVIEMEFPESGR